MRGITNHQGKNVTSVGKSSGNWLADEVAKDSKSLARSGLRVKLALVTGGIAVLVVAGALYAARPTKKQAVALVSSPTLAQQGATPSPTPLSISGGSPGSQAEQQEEALAQEYENEAKQAEANANGASSSSLTPSQAYQDELQDNAQAAAENAQYAANLQAEEQAAQQDNQACYSELSAQGNALAPIQNQIVQVETEEINLPATLQAQGNDGGGAITESAFQEELNRDMAQLQSQLQTLEAQESQVKEQYPTC